MGTPMDMAVGIICLERVQWVQQLRSNARWKAHGIQGTVKLFGTPAEETVVGKVYMANAGAFDGIDIIPGLAPLSSLPLVAE